MTLTAMGSLRPESVTANDSSQWDRITLDKLNHYDLDPEQAKKLLIKDGWTLNANGKKFVEGVDDIRYKKVGKELMRLSIRFAQAEDNQAAAMICGAIARYVAQDWLRTAGGRDSLYGIAYGLLPTGRYTQV